MGYKEDQEKKNKLFTIATIVVLFFAVLPIVGFAVFSVVTTFNPPIRNSSAIEEPKLDAKTRRQQREEARKKAEEEAKAQIVTQNQQPVIITQTIPQPPNGMMGPGMGMGFGGQFDPAQMGGFGMGMGGQFGNFDPANMPQFDPSQFQGMGMGMGFGQGGFGMGQMPGGFDMNNMPQFDPTQIPQGGFGGFQGMQGGMPDFGGMQGGFGQGFGGMQGGFGAGGMPGGAPGAGF